MNDAFANFFDHLSMVAVILSRYAAGFCVNFSLRGNGLLSARTIPTYTKKVELYALFKLALACPTNTRALEIGSYLGASTCYLVAGLARNGGHLFCVDTWQNETMPEGQRDTYSEFLENIRPIRDRVSVIRKNSREVGSNDIETPLGLVFIDGDHRYECVKQDFALASEWLSENGIIAFHDCLCFSGVARTIGEALATGAWVTAGQVENLCWIRHASSQQQ